MHLYNLFESFSFFHLQFFPRVCSSSISCHLSLTSSLFLLLPLSYQVEHFRNFYDIKDLNVTRERREVIPRKMLKKESKKINKSVRWKIECNKNFPPSRPRLPLSLGSYLLFARQIAPSFTFYLIHVHCV